MAVPVFHRIVWMSLERCSQSWTFVFDTCHVHSMLLCGQLLLWQGTSEEVLVYTGLSGDALQYEDTASVLTPHTAYQYRIIVRNSVGLSYGPWAEVTTRSSSKWPLSNILLFLPNGKYPFSASPIIIALLHMQLCRMTTDTLCVCACVRACVSACVRACMRACIYIYIYIYIYMGKCQK